jgi:hypothetical protein
MNEPLFWCVWCDGGGSPTVKHREFDTAKREAQRLARMNPGQRFVVLAAALAYQKRDLDEIRFDQDRPIWADDMDAEVPF